MFFRFQYDFGDRFEMVLVVPSGDASDISKLDDALVRSLATDDPSAENMLDAVDKELKSVRGGALDVTLTMPQFKISGDIEVNYILREVGLVNFG